MKHFEVVLNIPSPYRLHLLNVLWEELKGRGINFHVHFMAKSHPGHPKSWENPKIDFPHTYWNDYGIKTHHFNPGLIWHLLMHTPDYLLVGSPYDTFTTILLAFVCRAKVSCCWVEGNTKKPGKLDGFVGWLKRSVLSKYKFVGVAGKESVDFIGLHQARTKKPMPKPVLLPNIVDESRFKPRAKWPQDQISSRRAELGIKPDEKLCIIPARLVALKGLDGFLRAVEPKSLDGWKVLIVGDGPEKKSLETIIKERGIESKVILLPFVAYEEMPLLYAAADLFMLTSYEDANPLCVVEALHSGLPIALTDQAGNVHEAVQEGCNGWLLPVRNKLSFDVAIQAVFSTDCKHLVDMGVASLGKAQFWNSQQCIQSFVLRLMD